MKILVTGHAGFVGRHMTKALILDGNEVTGVDRLPCYAAGVHNYVMDVRDYFRRSRNQFDLVIHLAAVVGGRQMIEGHPLEVAVDLAIDAEMFQWALRTRPGRVVYFSSSAAYPVAEQGKASRLLTEDLINLMAIRSPDETYGWAKLTGEMLAMYARQQGLAVTVLRPFSGYGEDQDLTYPFPAFVARARQREDPFEIWGDGNQLRDFIHIDDVIAATLAAVARGLDGPVNLGTGRPTSFNDLAAMMAEAVGYEPRLLHKRNKPVGVMTRVADPTKLLEFYTPVVELKQGIKQALRAR